MAFACSSLLRTTQPVPSSGLNQTDSVHKVFSMWNTDTSQGSWSLASLGPLLLSAGLELDVHLDMGVYETRVTSKIFECESAG